MFMVAMVAVLVTMSLALVRAARGPTVFDRILALNMFGTKTVLLIAVIAFMTGRPDFLDLALVYALMNFIGVIAVLRFSKYGHFGDPDDEQTPVTLETVLVAASWALIVGGSFFAVVGGIGLVRLPDFYTRIHGGGLTDTLGAWLILAGLMLQAGWSLAVVKLAMIWFFLMVTSPTSTHAVAQAALTHGVKPLLADEGDEPSTR